VCTNLFIIIIGVTTLCPLVDETKRFRSINRVGIEPIPAKLIFFGALDQVVRAPV
jgi:hypothetical protein